MLELKFSSVGDECTTSKRAEAVVSLAKDNQSFPFEDDVSFRIQ